jgi:hypothetical protein
MNVAQFVTSLAHPSGGTRAVLEFQRRAHTYDCLDADPKIGRRTAFFRAAAVVTRVLGSGHLTGFMRDLSASLEVANLARAQQIRAGQLYVEHAVGANTAHFIRFEQALVQEALDMLRTKDARQYAAEIDSADRALARMRLWCSRLPSTAHRDLHMALQQARAWLGRAPRFAIQSDREAIGLAVASM